MSDEVNKILEGLFTNDLEMIRVAIRMMVAHYNDQIRVATSPRARRAFERRREQWQELLKKVEARTH